MEQEYPQERKHERGGKDRKEKVVTPDGNLKDGEKGGNHKLARGYVVTWQSNQR